MPIKLQDLHAVDPAIMWFNHPIFQFSRIISADQVCLHLLYLYSYTLVLLQLDRELLLHLPLWVVSCQVLPVGNDGVFKQELSDI